MPSELATGWPSQ